MRVTPIRKKRDFGRYKTAVELRTHDDREQGKSTEFRPMKNMNKLECISRLHVCERQRLTTMYKVFKTENKWYLCLRCSLKWQIHLKLFTKGGFKAAPQVFHRVMIFWNDYLDHGQIDTELLHCRALHFVDKQVKKSAPCDPSSLICCRNQALEVPPLFEVPMVLREL